MNPPPVKIRPGRVTAHQIAYVVPTKDRPNDLAKLLESLRRQTSPPRQIIIVDASEAPIASLCETFPELSITYVRVFPPSLARQRNAGMAALSDGITIAGYLDDDLELAPDATERMLAFWEAAGEKVGGAAFSIVNQPRRHPVFGFVADLFLLNGKHQGRLLVSGFATSIGTPEEDLRTEWLYGGATIWRRDIIASFSYDEWYVGHGFLEDVDYSYRVSRDHDLWVIAGARVWHWPHPILKSKNVSLGVQQVVNRFYFVRKFRHFSCLALAWAIFGQCVINLLNSVREVKSDGLLRFSGNLKGLALVISGHRSSVDGVWK